MTLGSARPVPVLFEFPDDPGRQECWGRFAELRSDGAVLASAAPVDKGARLRLRFDLPGGDSVSGLEGDVLRSRRDGDGYCEAVLVWRLCAARLKLNRALNRLFAA